MCDLCDPETKEVAIKAHHRKADKLRELARIYEELATGHIKPHSDRINDVDRLARSIVRFLVEAWV